MPIHDNQNPNVNNNDVNVNKPQPEGPFMEQEYKSGTFEDTSGEKVKMDENIFKEAFSTYNGNQGGLDKLQGFFFNVLGGDGVSERISALADAGKTYYETSRKSNTGNGMQVDFIIAPGRRIADFYGGVIVAVPMRSANGQSVEVGAHLIIVESSTRLKPWTVNHEGQQLVIPNTPSNVVGPATIEGVSALVREHYGTEVKVVEAGFSVLPFEADIANTAFVNQILTHAANACYTRLQLFHATNVTDEGVLLANIMSDPQRDITVSAQIEDHPPAQYDLFGNPIRADFLIRTLAVQNGNQNGVEQGMCELGTVVAYCTPLYAAPVQPVNPYMPHIPNTRHYYNMVVIRELRQGNVRLSIGNAIMLIATAGLLATNNLWRRAYIPDNHIPSGQLDIKDIGAFGYEVPQLNHDGKPGKIDTKTAEFNNEAFTKYMDTLFHPEIIYAIDVPDGHYLMNVFMSEANNNPNAHAVLLNILNSMTGGRFGRYFDATQPFFKNENKRIINGYYKSATKGTNVSVDVLDHLAMLNLVSGEATALREFETTFNHGPQALRVAKRLDILNALSDNTATVKGYSNRLYFNPAFIEAAMRAMKECRIFPEIQGGNYANMNAYVRPTVDMFAGLTVNPNHIPNMFGGFGNHNYGDLKYGYNGFQM